METAKRAVCSQRRGSALVLVLLALSILFVTGTGLLSLSLHGQVLAIRTGAEIEARCAADAGLTKALFEMNEKLKVTPWDDSNLPWATDEELANSDAIFSYTVTGDSDSGYIIESTGKFGRAERKVDSTLRLRGPFEHAIFTVGTIYMEQNNLVTGYDSETGDTDIEGTIGTISTASGSITLGNNTVVDGDVFVGVGGDVETATENFGTINGETYALSDEVAFAVITAPLLFDMGTNIDVNSSDLTIGPFESGKYTGIIIGNNKTLEIAGGDVVLYVTGDIDMGNGAKIQIKDGSSLILYLDGSITGSGVNDAELNNETGIPGNLKLYLTGGGEQVIQFKNNSDIFGVIYAPGADVTFKNNTDFHGSITAKSVTLKNNANIYYDASLRDASVSDDGVRFVVKRWREPR